MISKESILDLCRSSYETDDAHLKLHTSLFRSLFALGREQNNYAPKLRAYANRYADATEIVTQFTQQTP
jgi:hypothetical protein